MTPAEQFQQAYDAFLADYNATKAQNAALSAQVVQQQARIDGLVALIDQLHLLAHAPLA